MMSDLDAPSLTEPPAHGRHIVDELIRERAQRLSRSRFWPLTRSVLYPLLGHGRAVAMADAIRDMGGAEALDHVSAILSLKTDVTGLEHIPREGVFILAPNHPTGIVDGVAVWDVLKPVRPDMAFFANRDAIRVCEGFRDVLIPVEWVAEKRTRERSRETLTAANRAFLDEKAVVLFASGRIAFWDRTGAQGGLETPPWAPWLGPLSPRARRARLVEQAWPGTLATFARKYDAPVVPLHITATNSAFYYLFWRLSPELRDMTLFHEMLNKKNTLFRLRFGAPIPASDLKGAPDLAARRVRAHVTEDLPRGVPWNPDRPATPVDETRLRFARTA